MATQPAISFAKFSSPSAGTTILLAEEGATLAAQALACDPGGTLPRAFDVIDFKGRFGALAELLAPAGSPLDRVVVIGAGRASELTSYSWLRLGGMVAAQLRSGKDATVVVDLVGREPSAGDVAELASGLLLRSYAFDKYRTRKGGDEGKQDKPARITIQCVNPAAARKAFADAKAVVDGVILARDLVNEPANTLGPVELADQAKGLATLGVNVEILTEKEMKKLGMGALLGVAQGASRPARMAVMRWGGGKAKDKPVVFRRQGCGL
jgi:leucyl aminopeptidase